MSLRFIESFGSFPRGVSATTADALLVQSGYWSAFSFYNGTFSAGLFGDTCIGYNGEQGQFIKLRSMPVPGVTFTQGIRVFRSPLSGYNPCLCWFNSATGHVQLTVMFGEYGVVTVYRGHPAQSGSAVIMQSAGGVFLNDVWFMAEAQATIDPSAGAITVKINAGIPSVLTGIVIQATGLNTSFDGAGAGTNVDMVGWGNSNVASGGGWQMMHYYVTDPAGSVNTGFLGNVRAQWLTTASAGAQTQLTIGGSAPAATNWQSVKDYLLDEAQFVETPTVGDYDLYGLEALITPGTIFGVQSRISMRQDDATQLAGQAVLVSGSTTVEGAMHLLNETQAHYTDIYENDPNTSAAWLAAAVNAIQLGPKLASSA